MRGLTVMLYFLIDKMVVSEYTFNMIFCGIRRCIFGFGGTDTAIYHTEQYGTVLFGTESC